MPTFVLLALAAAQDPVVLGYYPSWAASPSVREVRYERFTHLAHAFLQAGEDGRLKADPKIPSADFARRAREKGAKPLLSLGGAQSAPVFRAIVKSPAALRAYVDAVADAATTHGYQGADVDWEPTESEEDRTGLVALLKALRPALGAKVPGAFLTAAAPSGPWGGRWWDAEALEPLLDLLNVMTYDVHGPWSPHAGHNAPLRTAPDDRECGPAASVEGSIAYWLDQRRWAASKLAMGIPCYGRGFAVQRWLQTPAKKAARETIDYKDVAGLVSGGWVRGFDPKVGVPTLVSGSELISFEDPESAALKGAWARERKLRGIFFWNVEQDFTDGDHAVVAAAAKAFRGR
jgi:chitinase